VVETRCIWSFILPKDRDTLLRVRSARADAEVPFRFGILSDIQRAVTEVSDIFTRMNEASDLTFVLSTGDLTNQGKAGELDFLQQQLELLKVPFFTTLGNHELGVSPAAFHDWFGRVNFHFEFGGVHFTLLDSASGTLDPIVYDWLDGWLDQGRDHLHVVGMHLPPLDPVGLRNGGFASRNEAAKLLAQLADGGVDLTFYGHIHSYYRFENAGIEAHISGGGGGLPERFDGIGRHYLTVEADPQVGTLATRVVRVD
jgi:3',5'-cyclic AMP phosphodiesterase CpdA